MLGADPNGLFNITDLGTTLFLGNAVISILLLYFVIRGNVPVSIPTENYAKAFVGRIVIAVLLAMMASTPATGPAAPLAGMVGSLALLGPGYFVYSMIFDVIVAAHVKEAGVLRRIQDSCLQPTQYTVRHVSCPTLGVPGAEQDVGEG
jgi:hypothetical protein